MSKVIKGVSALAAMFAVMPVSAFATEGWYGRVDAGYTFDSKIDTETTALGDDSIDLDNDWAAFGGLGYAFKNGFRMEGELGHRQGDLDLLSPADGDGKVWSAMANLFYDFNRAGRIQPYVGAGIGVAKVDYSVNDGAGLIADDDDTGLAYQGLAGIAFGLTERLALDVGYRYFAAENIEFKGLNGVTPFSEDIDYDAHTATVGLRWQFAAPAAPVPAAPPAPEEVAPPAAACPTDAFKVYFEWDRSSLNQAALETIDAAVARAKACNMASVAVEGHADTSGSPKYNIGLSEARAAVVRDALVARGVPTEVVTTQGFGENQLDKATKDGVREPLNRRSVVTISFR